MGNCKRLYDAGSTLHWAVNTASLRVSYPSWEVVYALYLSTVTPLLQNSNTSSKHANAFDEPFFTLDLSTNTPESLNLNTISRIFYSWVGQAEPFFVFFLLLSWPKGTLNNKDKTAESKIDHCSTSNISNIWVKSSLPLVGGQIRLHWWWSTLKEQNYTAQ